MKAESATYTCDNAHCKETIEAEVYTWPPDPWVVVDGTQRKAQHFCCLEHAVTELAREATRTPSRLQPGHVIPHG